MNNENTQKLFDRFKFFHHELLRLEKGYLVRHGFTCGDGWFNLIWKLSMDIEKIAPPAFAVTQVKEKLGTLRYYAYNPTNNIHIRKLIHKAERKSAHTCELCGSTKKIKCRTLKHRRLKTLCNKCYAIAILEE